MSFRLLVLASLAALGCATGGPPRPENAREHMKWSSPGEPWMDVSGPHVVDDGNSTQTVDSLSFIHPESGSRIDGYVFVGANAKAQAYADALMKRWAGRDCASSLPNLPETGAVVISTCDGDTYTAFLKPPKAPHMLIILKGTRKGDMPACDVTGAMRKVADSLVVTNPY